MIMTHGTMKHRSFNQNQHNHLKKLVFIILLLSCSFSSLVHSQLSKPVSRDQLMQQNKFTSRSAVEVEKVMFGTDATGFHPNSNCKHNVDIVWSNEVGSSIYQTPTITYLDAKSPYKDIVIPTFVRFVEALHGPTGSEKHGSDDNSIWPFSHSKFVSHSSTLLYDIDKDGEQEVVVTTANAEVVFLKASGRILREMTIKLLPLRLDKYWYQGLNDETMDISMNLMGDANARNRRRDIPVQQQQGNDNNNNNSNDPGQVKNTNKSKRNRKLLQVQTPNREQQGPMSAGTDGLLSAEARESMKLIYIPQSMRALIDEIDRQDDPFEPLDFEEQLKEQKRRDKLEHRGKDSIYVDAHLLNNPVIIDLDQDGHDEIIFAATYFYDEEYYESDPYHMAKLDPGIDIHKYVAGGVVVYDLVTMKKKWDLHLDLTTDRTKTRAHIYSSPTVIDLDSDGSLEIIVATSMGWIYVIDKNGKPKEGFPVLMGEIQGQIIAEDVNNDGDIEICAGDSNSNIVCFDYKGKEIWEKVVSGKISTAPAVADLNGDGILEIIVATTSGHIWALRGTDGEALMNYPLKTDGPILSTPSILGGMVKADPSSLTIIVPSHDGFIYFIDSKSLCIDKIDIGERIYSQILIDDVTSNGYMNLIVTTMNGNVFNLGTEVPYDPMKAITGSVGVNGFAYRHNYHGIMVTPQSRKFRDEFGSTFKVEFEIVDNRKMPSHIPRRYTVKISVGGSGSKQILMQDKNYDQPGRYVVTIPTPRKRFHGKVVVTMTNEHGAVYEDSYNLGFNISFLNMFKWMIVVPFMLSASLLLHLFGTDVTSGVENQKKKPVTVSVPPPQQSEQIPMSDVHITQTSMSTGQMMSHTL